MDEEKKGLVSYLVMLEAVEVLRAIEAREFKTLIAMNNSERLDNVLGRSREMFNKIISETTISPQLQFMDNLSIDITSLLTSAVTILNDLRGSIEFKNRCKKCNTELSTNYFSGHRCVGAVDIIHVLLAQKLTCDEFITFDKAFEEIKSFEAVQPLQIHVI